MKLKKLSKEVNSQFPFTFGAGYQNTTKGRNKPNNITFDQLRHLEKNNDLVSICVNKIVHRVKAQPWHVKAKDSKRTEELQSYIDRITELLSSPNQGLDESFDDVFSKVVKDLCIIDSGVIEKVRNSKGEIKELYYVDGATIKPNMTEYGTFADPAYYQFLPNSSAMGSSTIPDAEFTKEDLIVMQINPCGESGKAGYGESPVEKVVMTVLTSLQAMVFNSTYFDDSKLPPYIFNLKGMPADTLQNFRLQFESQLSNNPWKNAYVNVEDLQSQALRPSNTDMQFQQFNEFLMHVIFAAFELAPETLGFTANVNRATAQVQDKHSDQDGVGNYLDAVMQKINHDIIGDFAGLDPKFNEIEFEWEFANNEDPKVKAEVSEIYLRNGVLLIDEVRRELGKEPIDGGDEVKAGQGDKNNFTSEIAKSLEKWETIYK